MTNTGTEKPATENAESDRSNHPPMRHAAKVPKGTATHTASKAVPKAKDRLGSIRWVMSSSTGLPK